MLPLPNRKFFAAFPTDFSFRTCRAKQKIHLSLCEFAGRFGGCTFVKAAKAGCFLQGIKKTKIDFLVFMACKIKQNVLKYKIIKKIKF